MSLHCIHAEFLFWLPPATSLPNSKYVLKTERSSCLLCLPSCPGLRESYIWLLFCFVGETGTELGLWSTHNMQLETCLVADGLTLTLYPPYDRSGNDSGGNYKWNWGTQLKNGVLGITLAIVNWAALYRALDLFISSLWKGNTEPHFAPHPGTCQGSQTVTTPGSVTYNFRVSIGVQDIETETHHVLPRQA